MKPLDENGFCFFHLMFVLVIIGVVFFVYATMPMGIPIWIALPVGIVIAVCVCPKG